MEKEYNKIYRLLRQEITKHQLGTIIITKDETHPYIFIIRPRQKHTQKEAQKILGEITDKVRDYCEKRGYGEQYGNIQIRITDHEEKII